jgi:hypothetical protein
MLTSGFDNPWNQLGTLEHYTENLIGIPFQNVQKSKIITTNHGNSYKGTSINSVRLQSLVVILMVLECQMGTKY